MATASVLLMTHGVINVKNGTVAARADTAAHGRHRHSAAHGRSKYLRQDGGGLVSGDIQIMYSEPEVAEPINN